MSSRRQVSPLTLCATGAILCVFLVLPSAVIASESGKPDFSGTYDAATLTPLVRPAQYGDNLYLTPEEAKKIADEEALLLEARNSASDPDREAPPAHVVE